ncbi:MAG: TetR/AcrR family transcriptional regulator [Anaerolineae bacterium]|nr:TetR/AcrR family transcriptional regulator [Anaerolineae bacterium]
MTDTDKREQIIDGALKVFSTHGFYKASIKMIAKAAGIKSAALIYHYFADKKGLLEAIIQERTPIQQLPTMDDALRVQMMAIPPEVLLPQILRNALTIQDNPELVNLIRLFLSEAVRMPEVADAVGSVQVMVVGILVDYLQMQIDKGQLKSHNTQVSARMFIGTVLIHILAHQIFPKIAEGFGERDAYIQQVVDTFLNGLKE